MPDILLIQPPVRDFYITAKRTIPYGLACIAAPLIANGFKVEIFDALATPKSRPLDWPPEMAYLKKFYGRPDLSPFALFHRYRHFGYSFGHIGKIARESGAFLIGISSLFTPYSIEALKTAEIVKKFHPAGRIVLGGHHPTAFPEKALASPAVDFILRGEGEDSLLLLAKALKKGEPVGAIPGIAFRRDDGRLQINPPAVKADPDRSLLPAVHLIKHGFYRRNKRGSIVITTSRGCPFKCSYCSLGADSGIKYRRRRVASVMKEIEAAVTRYDVGFIDFEDENLSVNKAWFLRLLYGIKRQFPGKDLELRAMNGLLPSSLDNETIGAMKAAGFKILNLSLGSMSATQLQRFQRPDVRRGFESAVRLAESHGLGSVGYLIAGAPNQRADVSLKDLLYLASRRVLAGLSIYYPAPGSADFELCDRIGLLPDHPSLLRSSCLPVSHTTSRMEAATLLRLARILNFMKALVDRGIPIPPGQPFDGDTTLDPRKRRETGLRMLRWFLNDGVIRGIRPDGSVYRHYADGRLVHMFLDGIRRITIRGSGIYTEKRKSMPSDGNSGKVR